MQRQAVQSSNIRSIGHENDTLHVEFTNGKVYAYPGVSAQKYQEFVNAESIGRHFAREIRPNFTGTLVPEEKPAEEAPK